LGRLATSGSSELPWPEAESALADLIAEVGPPSRTGRAQSAAYPFTRLRSDGVWVLDCDVPMDLIGPLAAGQVTGRFEASLQAVLRASPELVRAAARDLVLSNFPDTAAPDVLEAAGLDPGLVLDAVAVLPGPAGPATVRRRDSGWRPGCCRPGTGSARSAGMTGSWLRPASASTRRTCGGLPSAAPDALDNGMALCVLHHKLFDLGVLGLDRELQVLVSAVFTARTDAGRAVYALHGRKLKPRPGTLAPAAAHVAWHAREVFKGEPLTT